MDDLNEKTELCAEEILQIRYTLAYKSQNWLISGGRFCDGIEIFRTQDEEKFVIKDVETGVKLGMRKQVKDGGVITHLTFFEVNE